MKRDWTFAIAIVVCGVTILAVIGGAVITESNEKNREIESNLSISNNAYTRGRLSAFIDGMPAPIIITERATNIIYRGFGSNEMAGAWIQGFMEAYNASRSNRYNGMVEAFDRNPYDWYYLRLRKQKTNELPEDSQVRK